MPVIWRLYLISIIIVHVALKFNSISLSLSDIVSNET